MKFKLKNWGTLKTNRDTLKTIYLRLDDIV